MSHRATISIQTLGCKLNQAESESMARMLDAAGFSVASGDRADAFILNTCTVTHIADRKCRHMVRMLRKENPRAIIVVTGCYAERAGEEIRKCGADLVVDNSGKMSVPLLLQERLSGSDKTVEGVGLERVRSFIKIQDGCRNSCSYCIVPLVRGNVYSVEAAAVLQEIKTRVSDGYREVVLTGTEIGSYRDGDTGLGDLVGMILKETGVARLRLSSLQPQQIDDGLLELWQDRRLCRHFHIALQSGSDTVLKRMRRRYDKSAYLAAVDRIRDIIPDAAVTTDIMVGFPAESDAEFRESYMFCREMEFAALHVFSYSPRPGTLAAAMQGQVDDKVKKQRSLKMLELAASSAEKFAGRFTGKTLQVLWENEVRQGSGIYSGLTDNYIRVYAASESDLTNTISGARIVGPARELGGKMLKASTKGNYGELWSEVIE